MVGFTAPFLTAILKKACFVLPYMLIKVNPKSQYLSNSRKYLVFDENEPALFVNINGTRMTRQGLWKIIKQYATLAGIEKEITPGTLRHSFATHLLENGADVSMLRDVLGHSDISSTNMYVNFLKRKSNNSLMKFHPHA